MSGSFHGAKVSSVAHGKIVVGAEADLHDVKETGDAGEDVRKLGA